MRHLHEELNHVRNPILKPLTANKSILSNRTKKKNIECPMEREGDPPTKELLLEMIPAARIQGKQGYKRTYSNVVKNRAGIGL